MTFATSNRMALRRVAETVLNTTPSTPTLLDMRYTSESLNYNVSNIQSEEIRSDRQTSDLIQVQADGAGDIGVEFSYDSYDAELIAAFASTWGSALSISASDISAANADSSFNSVGGDFGSVVVGQWIKVAGFTETANNGYFKVVTATSTVITVTGTLTDEAAGDTVTIDGTMMRNGTTLRSLTYQKHIQDISTPAFMNFTGACVNSMNLNFETGQILKGSFGLMAMASAISDAQITGASVTSAGSTTPMNAVSNVAAIYQDGSAMTAQFQSLSCNLVNSIRPQDAVGSLAHVGMALGKLDISGGINLYFEDRAMYGKYIDATAFSLAFRVTDISGNTYILTFPNVKFESGTIVSGGLDQDMMFNATWRAVRDSTTDSMVQIDKFAA